MPRSVLEWRCDPTSGFANPVVAESDRPLILVCAEGYSSSLAAAALIDLGVRDVGDLVGGYEAWVAAGLPTMDAPPLEPGPAGDGTAVLSIDRDRLVATASSLIDVHSFTGDEQAMAERMVELYDELGLQVQWQQVEDGRANALGTWSGTGGGKTLMFNGHMDTSYSGREPWLQGRAGLPAAGVRPRRPALRARHLEHEGRARLLRRGGARAAGRRRAAEAATC